MKSFKRKSNISTVAALLTFAVFAVCVVSVLLYGAKAYKNLTGVDSENYTYRTCAQFINTKLHQGVCADRVSTGRFGDGDCIIFEETIEGDDYLTGLYCHDGWLCELFISKDAGFESFEPQDGEKVLEASVLQTSLKDGLLSVAINDSADHRIEMNFALRGWEAQNEK